MDFYGNGPGSTMSRFPGADGGMAGAAAPHGIPVGAPISHTPGAGGLSGLPAELGGQVGQAGGPILGGMV